MEQSNAEEAAVFFHVEPFGDIDRVVVAVPGEEAAFAEFGGEFERRVAVDAYRQRGAAAIEARGGRSLNLPELADRVTDAMNKGRLTIERALGELSLGDRMELGRWRDDCKAMLSEVAGG